MGGTSRAHREFGTCVAAVRRCPRRFVPGCVSHLILAAAGNLTAELVREQVPRNVISEGTGWYDRHTVRSHQCALFFPVAYYTATIRNRRFALLEYYTASSKRPLRSVSTASPTTF